MRLAYLCSKYPYVSHTFVLREVEALRDLGVQVATFSVRRTAPEHVLAEADRRAMATTYSILPTRLDHLLVAAARGLATSPRRAIATLATAIRLNPGGVRGLFWQLFYFGEALILWDRCRREGIRHIHSHFANNAADIGLLAARLGGHGWRWSFTMHGPAEFADVGRHRLRQKVEEAELVICISDFCRSQLMRFVGSRHWAKLHTVHCAVDPECFRVQRRERIATGSVHILTVARLTPNKGVILLVEALASLVAEGVDARLTIVGEGPEKGPIAVRASELGVRDRVELAGFVGQDELPQRYADADVFCLPSFAEGVPVVLMEAMAAELPVVATRIMGIPELVEHEQSGLLVTPARVDELVRALARLASDPEECRAMGANGRRMVEAEFSSERVAEELRLVFQRSPAASSRVPLSDASPIGARG